MLEVELNVGGGCLSQVGTILRDDSIYIPQFPGGMIILFMSCRGSQF